ncbi:Phosphoribosyl isomerase A [Planctomycetes bacterium Pla163]|uniref:Histidine biosynthesis bifunctional protein HisIE n=1 Tax=Rohdeia mirabilis TaxID=2528008 RepID=A0A518D2I9_9BACT|nr:Phosphoribosyl isomerase A [Planctomycetes bacterium Pla163]
MIVPSIDLQAGNAVQLVGGERLELDAGDPFPIAERFARCGTIAVVDLDAALGRGDNRAVWEELCRRHTVRVGGGLRSAEAVRAALDAGAESVVLGSAATPELFRELGPELCRSRVFAALDARDGEVVTHGWTRGSGRSIEDGIAELAPFVRGFLVTFVEREGRLGGCDLERAASLRERCDGRELTIAGGVTTAGEVAALDAAGCDAQVGMALYTGRLPLGAGFAAPLASDRPDGLVPTVVCDPSGRALGLVYSDTESIERSLRTGRAWFRSRRRGLWEKGASSGDGFELLRFDVDCDRDALRAIVRPVPGASGRFCHLEQVACFGAARGLAALERTLQDRRLAAPRGSYTARLFDDSDLLGAKLVEEACELAAESAPERVAEETADLVFFALAKCAACGVSLADVEAVLDRRSRRATRRPGSAKSTAVAREVRS